MSRVLVILSTIRKLKINAMVARNGVFFRVFVIYTVCTLLHRSPFNLLGKIVEQLGVFPPNILKEKKIGKANRQDLAECLQISRTMSRNFISNGNSRNCSSSNMK